MLYQEFMNKATDLVVTTDEDTGISFLEPDYYAIMIFENMDPEHDISDVPVSWQQFAERMKLEAERRNAIDDRTKFVMDWLFQLLTAGVEPAMMQEETELIKNVMSYMNLNQELKEKEKTLQQKEESLDQKQSVVQLMPGMNFSKRGPGKD